MSKIISIATPTAGQQRPVSSLVGFIKPGTARDTRCSEAMPQGARLEHAQRNLAKNKPWPTGYLSY